MSSETHVLTGTPMLRRSPAERRAYMQGILAALKADDKMRCALRIVAERELEREPMPDDEAEIEQRDPLNRPDAQRLAKLFDGVETLSQMERSREAVLINDLASASRALAELVHHLSLDLDGYRDALEQQNETLESLNSVMRIHSHVLQTQEGDGK